MLIHLNQSTGRRLIAVGNFIAQQMFVDGAFPFFLAQFFQFVQIAHPFGAGSFNRAESFLDLFGNLNLGKPRFQSFIKVVPVNRKHFPQQFFVSLRVGFDAVGIGFEQNILCPVGVSGGIHSEFFFHPAVKNAVAD